MAAFGGVSFSSFDCFIFQGVFGPGFDGSFLFDDFFIIFSGGFISVLVPEGAGRHVSGCNFDTAAWTVGVQVHCLVVSSGWPGGGRWRGGGVFCQSGYNPS